MARQEEPVAAPSRSATPPSWVITRTGSATASACRRRRRRRLDIHSGTSAGTSGPASPRRRNCCAVPVRRHREAGHQPGTGHTGVGSLRAMAEEARSESDLPIRQTYGPDDLAGFDPAAQLGEPGEFPYTRGVYASMYTGRPWTMRQYAGFGTAKESQRAVPPAGRRRHRRPQRRLRPADPDGLRQRRADRARRGRQGRGRHRLDRRHAHPVRRAAARRGLHLDDDQRARLGAPAALPAGRGGARDPRRQAHRDHPERRAQGVHRARHLHLPAEGVAPARLATSSPTATRRSRAGTRSPSPATTWPRPGPRQCRRSRSPCPTRSPTSAPRRRPASTSTTSRPRLSFFFVARTTLLEEVAKFRAARRIWARVMRDDFGATNPKSLMLRFHTQTAGVQLTAQQPEVNLVRVALQGLGAVLGGTQSLHTNSFDEAIALPDGEGRPPRAADPAGHRLRDRRHEDRRPVRRFVRRRGDDRRHRGSGTRADAGRRGQGRGGRRHRGGLPEVRDRAQRLPDRPRDRQQGAHHRRAQPVPARPRGAVRAAARRPADRARPGGPARGPAGRPRQRGRRRGTGRISETQRPGPTTCSTR